MNIQFNNDARLSVEKAREALRNDNRTEARQWAEHAASLAPQMEDPWLILAAVASPRASVEYLQTALKINPNSERARRDGMGNAKIPREPSAGINCRGSRARSKSGKKRKQIRTETQPSISDSAYRAGMHHLQRGGLVRQFIAYAGIHDEQSHAD